MAHTNNAKYVERGAGLVVKYNPGWEKDLKNANRHKEGAPFLYAEGMIMAMAALRTAFMIPYRQLSGMIREILKGTDSPCYTTIFRRMQKLDVDIAENIITVRDKTRNLVMIADATGLKQHNRGEWIRKKWKVRRGFVKMPDPPAAAGIVVPSRSPPSHPATGLCFIASLPFSCLLIWIPQNKSAFGDLLRIKVIVTG